MTATPPGSQDCAPDTYTSGRVYAPFLRASGMDTSFCVSISKSCLAASSLRSRSHHHHDCYAAVPYDRRYITATPSSLACTHSLAPATEYGARLVVAQGVITLRPSFMDTNLIQIQIPPANIIQLERVVDESHAVTSQQRWECDRVFIQDPDILRVRI